MISILTILTFSKRNEKNKRCRLWFSFHSIRPTIATIKRNRRLGRAQRNPTILAGSGLALTGIAPGYFLIILDTCSAPVETIATRFACEECYKNAPKTYLIATNITQTHSMPLIILAGTNFCVRAPRYIPKNPPAPNRTPNHQSGATDTSG